ncbi:IcmT/TraK family protein [Acetobacter sacchari]|uniref:IcmT/TraK family protein n=1 Tax=Acetobacter sacchari TaxID=2661687 RepID=A0ABS3LW79_9PROT|nr:IcmT/TraK family protein [Acetobacter sacchari]MBO1360159.1 IcmT/TraK family protein [Acetobacter sacchari]
MWRGTGLPVRVFILDARSCLPILLAVVDWSWTTLIIGLVSTVFFGVISFFGLTMPAALRAARRWLVGNRRTALPTWKRRRFS